MDSHAGISSDKGDDMFKKLASKLFHKKKSFQKSYVFTKPMIDQFVHEVMEILYPHFGLIPIHTENDLLAKIKKCELTLLFLLGTIENNAKANRDAKNFFKKLSDISDALDHDAEAIFKGDPAAKSIDEVIFCYPGFFAIAIHRMAHFFNRNDVPIFPRMLSEYAHQLTGIDIHPGATIGKFFCIDHGTGVVIGETSVIGDHVKIYQGVTLGALSVDKKMQGSKRHPTIEDNCVIYANATILGGKTIISKGSVIGGSVWITKSVKKNSVIFANTEASQILSSRKR